MTKVIGIGIDLGTTNCCVSIWRSGRYEIITTIHGNTFPSIISVTKNDRYVSHDAINNITDEKNVFSEIKRLIGRKYSDVSVQVDKDMLSFDIIPDDDDNILIKSNVNNKVYTPEELTSMLLSNLKNEIEEYLRTQISNVVITIPAYFNDSQREATKTAATIAGLNCIRMINEPTSASLAYGYEERSRIQNKDITVLIVDIGGGTTDISVVNINDGVFTVIASSGNTHLGGCDFDYEIARYSIEEFMQMNNIDETNEISQESMTNLKNACERAKKILSKKHKTYISVSNFYDGKNLFVPLTRKKIEELCNSLITLCIKPIENVLMTSNLNINDIDDVILVGGTTKMPAVKNAISQYFNKEPNTSINPDEVVAIGASIQAYIIQNKNDAFSKQITLLDITPLSLGIEIMGGIMDIVIPRNSNIPTKATKIYTNDTDFVDSISIKIYEGERTLTSDNFLIAEFELNNVIKGPKGSVVIEITFSIDVNGMITVSAEDKSTENIKYIKITNNNKSLSHDKIEKIIEDARQYEEIDKRNKEKKRSAYILNDQIISLKHCIEFNTNIQENIKNDILIMINKIEKHILDKNTTINKNIYDDYINEIKNKYDSIILNAYQIEKNKHEQNETTNASIFDDDDEKLDDECYVTKHNVNISMDKDAFESRNYLVERCNEIKNSIKNNDIDYLSSKDIELLCDTIDDTLSWSYIKKNLTKSDYDDKLNNIDSLCNDIFDKYNKYSTENDLCNKCNAVMDYINNVCDNDDNLLNMIHKTISDMKSDTDMDYGEKIKEIDDCFYNFYKKSLENTPGTSISKLKDKNKINFI